MEEKWRQYYCYFVIAPKQKLIYIGVSYAENKSAILRKHLRGEIPCTSHFFGAGSCQVIPFLHVRPAEYRGRNRAEEEVSGWNRYYVEQGYQLLRPEETGPYIETSTAAETIYIANRDREVEEVLHDAGTYNFWSTSGGDKTKTACQRYPAERASVMLSIRTTPAVAEAFRNLCQDLEVTQSQALGMLIDAYSGDTRLTESDLAGRLEQANDEVSKLKSELSDLSFDLQTHIHRLQAQIRILRKMIFSCIRHWPYAKSPDDKQMPVYSHRQAKMYFSERRDYHYPAEEGTALVQIDCLAYGKNSSNRGPAAVLYGRVVGSGEKIQLRCYDRREFAGKYPTMTGYRSRNLLWQVGYINAPDGAMDLIGALPMAKEWLSNHPGRSEEEAQLWEWVETQIGTKDEDTSLDGRIKKATERSKSQFRK